MNREKQSNNRKHKGEGLGKLVIPQSHRDPKISLDMKCQVLTRGKTLGQRKERNNNKTGSGSNIGN